jgi:hypothetical protein
LGRETRTGGCLHLQGKTNVCEILVRSDISSKASALSSIIQLPTCHISL